MSLKTMLRVWEHSQTQRAARCLMLALADFANDDGLCWPGTASLAKKINEQPDYTDTIIKKCIELGELAKETGRGRGHKTRFAILCGLDPDAQKRLKGVLQKGYSSTPFPKGVAHPPFSEKRGTTKGVLFGEKRGTFSDTNQSSFDAPERPEPPISEKMILHDPNHDDDDDGDRTRIFLESEGIGAAKEFTHLPYESMVLDYQNRIAAGQSAAIIVKAWRSNPPTKDYHYERQQPERPVQPQSTPSRPRRSTANGTHNGTGGADLKDPGWQQREIDRIQKLYNIPDSEL